MKKFLILVFFSSFLFGASYDQYKNRCGSFSSFPSFANTGKAGGNKNFRNIFKGFTCPPISSKDPQSVILSSINFENGEFQCEYFFEQEITSEERQKLVEEGKIQGNYIEDKGYAKNYKNDICSQVGDYYEKNIFSFIPKTIAPSEKIAVKDTYAKYIGTFPVESGEHNTIWFDYKTASIDLNFHNLRDTIKKIENTGNKQNVSVKKKTIDTNAFNEKNQTFSVSEYFTGILTLDPDIFDNTKPTLDKTGKIALKNKQIDLFTDGTMTLIPDFLQNAKIEIINPIDELFNGHFWGFYVAFIENLRLAEYKIVLMMFFTGFTFLVGQKMVSGAYAHFGDNEEKHHNMGISKMIVSPLLSLIIFVAPIVPSDLKIEKNFLKDTGDYQTGIQLGNNAHQGSSALDEIGNSTMIQTAIRHFAKWGTLAANELADYALYPYLNYLEFKQGAVVGDIAEVYKQSYSRLVKDFFVLERQVKFYEGFCKTIYKSNDEKDGVFLTQPMSGRTPSLLSDLTEKSYKKADVDKSFGFDTVSAKLCSKLEFDISKKTQKVFGEYSALESMVKNSEKFIEWQFSIKQPNIFNSESLATTEVVSKRMIEMQHRSGWIFSALVPVSYILLQTEHIGDTIEQREEVSKKFAITSGARENDILSNGGVKENLGESDLGMKHKIANMLVPTSAYFLLPHFSELFNGVYKLATTIEDIIMTFIDIVAGLVALAYPTLMLTLTIIVEIISIASAIATLYISYIASIILYNIFLQIITMTIVMLMAIFKIAMYFIELLIFFVMSPAVVIWAVVSKKSEVIWHYIGKGTVLCITPILLVLSCYLFMFASETLLSIYSYLAGLVSGIFVTGKTSFTTSIMVFTVVSIGNAIMLISNIIIGYITIIKSSQWFLETVGAKASVIDNFAGELGQKTERFYSVV